MPKQNVVTNSSVEHARLLSAQSRDTLSKVDAQLADQSAAGALARGKVFELVGYFAEAANSYVEALSYDRGLAEASGRLALALLKSTQNERALSVAMGLAARQPNFKLGALATDEQVSAMTILGDALVANNRLEDAKEAYVAARKIDSKDSYAAGRLAQIHLAEKDFKRASELRRDFRDNLRFQELNSLLSLGETSSALLPTVTRESLARNIAGSAVGRPLLVDGEVRCASIVEGDEGWCADPSEDLGTR